MIEKIKSLLRETKNITDGSISVYIRNLTKLNNGEELKDFKFLEDTSSIMNKLKDYKDTTKRNYLVSIVSILSVFPEYKELHDTYYDLMMKKKEEVEEEKAKGELSETQQQNWISWEKVLEIYKELEQVILGFYRQKTITDEEYNQLLAYALLSLYTLQEPRRNKDYSLMRVVENFVPELDPEFNYYDLAKKKFIFNNYKTSKKYGRKDIKVKPELVSALKKYLKFRQTKLDLDDQDNKALLIRSDKKPLDKSGDITKLLNKTFGKNIGSSMLRHINITDAVGGIHKALEEKASDMGHSVSEQKKYILKPRGKIIVQL